MPLPHRNLYNGDCTFLFGKGYLLGDGPYTAEVFHRFIDLLADSGVDTYLCNPNAQKPWYPSKVTEQVLYGYVRGDKEFFRGHYPPANDTDLPAEKLDRIMAEQVPFLNRYLDLAEAGVDWVAEISKACRRRGVMPWLSVRMNDLHGANSWEGSYMNAWMQKEPRYRLSGREINPRDGINRYEQALDFRHPEVRGYMFDMIRELVEGYDYEGLELDWLRTPHCLEPPADRAGIELMTEWTASIRALTRKRSAAIGKPYPLGLRVPPRLGMLREIGIDVPAMARAGLIDYVSPSNAWQTSWDIPYDELRAELGPGVAIYGVIEDAPNWIDALDPATGARGYRLLSASPELLRGNAAGKLALGVDGLETFNFFCSDEEGIHPTAARRQGRYDALRGLEDPEALRGQPKHYALASRLGHFMYANWEYAEQVPFVLEPQWKQAVRLSMGAEPAASRRGLELVIQVVAERNEDGSSLPDLGVSFNGAWPSFDAEPTDRLLFPTGAYTHHVPEHAAFNFRADPARIREGWNELLVFNGSKSRSDRAARRANSATVVSVELAVRPKGV